MGLKEKADQKRTRLFSDQKVTLGAAEEKLQTQH